MNLSRSLKFAVLTAACGAVLGLTPARAATLVVDDFTPFAGGGSLSGSGNTSQVSASGTFAGVASQFREGLFNLYADPSNSGASFSLGGGTASVTAGTGALGEYIISYGAFTRPVSPTAGGPLLGLDLSSFNDFRAEFSGVNKGLNLNVLLYTSNPLLGTGSAPLYYLQSGINIGPDTPGGPVVADLFLDARNAISAPAFSNFNFAQVDGIQLLIDRSGYSTGNAYALDRISFTKVPAVPEPSEYALMLIGLAVVGGVARRRRR